MVHRSLLEEILAKDSRRMAAIRAIGDLRLSDCWIAAGFVRNAVWDFLHGRPASELICDIDVIWFDADNSAPAKDIEIESALAVTFPGIRWSVKNQARMHTRNGDAPYRSSSDAMRHWPETATSVAIRLNHAGHFELNAPYGLDDLFNLMLRPTPGFTADKYPTFQKRMTKKHWLERWPKLRVVSTAITGSPTP